MKVDQVTKNIFIFDNDLYGIPEFGANYILIEDKKALVDCGPTTSVSKVLEALGEAGLKPEDIDYIIATHIHLDHAGGAGSLLKLMPKAKLVLHGKGARHLIDPSKLIASSKSAQGGETMDRNGDIVPVPESRMQIMNDGDKLELSKQQTLLFIDAPGHCPHQFCVFESRNRGVFVGDAVGNFAKEYDLLVPITPPPSFDYELYLKTLARLSTLNADYIYFAHFGVSDRVKEYLQRAVDKLQLRRVMVEKLIADGKLDLAVEQIKDLTSTELEPFHLTKPLLYGYWTDFSIRMSAEGFVKNYRERYLQAHN